ncbi:MAG: dTMP kinase [Rickettsiaceae bacterium]|nr:dTMP kinase [Rickettsiaceae bacterium]
MKTKAKFITFEGGEGCGKSTQSRKLFDTLQQQKIRVIHTREIGGTSEAEKIRDLIFSAKLDSMSEMLLIMAARYEHLKNLIIPALKDGVTVICDRYIDSTAVYQTINSDLTSQQVYALHAQCMKFTDFNDNDQGIMPDISFFLDLPPNEGLTRAFARGNLNKFDELAIDFHHKVYNKFKTIAQRTDRFHIIDCAEKDPEIIHQEILQIFGRKENA